MECYICYKEKECQPIRYGDEYIAVCMECDARILIKIQDLTLKAEAMAREERHAEFIFKELPKYRAKQKVTQSLIRRIEANKEFEELVNSFEDWEEDIYRNIYNDKIRKMLEEHIEETVSMDEKRSCNNLLRKFKTKTLSAEEKILLEEMYEEKQ